MRERLPEDRPGLTHKFEILIGEQATPLDLYLTVNTYPDSISIKHPNGRVCEVFAKIDKQGSIASGLLDGAMIALSVALQHGAPLKDIASKYKGMQFEPAGRVLNAKGDKPRHCTSLLDLIGRHLLETYPEVEV